MQEADEAFGTIAACANAFNDEYRGYVTQNGQQVMDIHHRGGQFTIVPAGTNSYLQAITARQLSNIEEFPITESTPIVELDDATLSDINSEIPMTNVQSEKLIHTPDDDPVEYFDGIRTSKPLFVFDEAFGLKDFDETLSKIEQINRRMFNALLTELDIEIDADNAEATDREHNTGPAFQ
jgi:hypothetical protein